MTDDFSHVNIVSGSFCSNNPSYSECEGGAVWNTCGMSCTITCDDPRPMCTKECVEKCQCPRSSPFLHEGQCVPHDRCPAKGLQTLLFVV